MIIIEEHLNSFCEIVKQGYVYYREMIEEFPRDYRIKEQINHLDSTQDSICKYDTSSKQGLLIRDLDIPYCDDLLKDASQFCNSDFSVAAKLLLIQSEHHIGD